MSRRARRFRRELEENRWLRSSWGRARICWRSGSRSRRSAGRRCSVGNAPGNLDGAREIEEDGDEECGPAEKTADQGQVHEGCHHPDSDNPPEQGGSVLELQLSGSRDIGGYVECLGVRRIEIGKTCSEASNSDHGCSRERADSARIGKIHGDEPTAY